MPVCEYREICVVLAVFVVSLLLLFVKRKYEKKKYFQGIPGPRPTPFVGNALDFLTSSSKTTFLFDVFTCFKSSNRTSLFPEFLSKIMEYTNTYGRVILVYARMDVILLVSDYNLTEHVLSSSKIIDKSNMYDFLHNWLGDGLLTSTGTKWKSRRKMLTPSFHYSILKDCIKIFESVGDKFIRRLGMEEGKPSVDISPLVSLYTLDVICESAMGTSINALDNGHSDYVRSVKTMCTIVADRIFSAVNRLFYVLTPNYFKERKALKILHAHTEAVIEKRIRTRSNKADTEGNVGAKAKHAFLDTLLDCNESLTKAEIREEVDTFMFEGHDTTSSALNFALYSLATNPDVQVGIQAFSNFFYFKKKFQRKVVEEQRRIFHDDVNAKVTLSSLPEMKYLELVIKETLRLYPSVPIIGRKLTEDLVWEGSVFPKGISIAVFIFGIHRNPKYFEDAEAFVPERFKSCDGSKPFSYVPFSAGPRQKFATYEMKTTISKVIRNFELLPSIPKRDLELAPETILVSKNGVHISLRKRKWF
ncbi:hypothetical protein NQ315_017065 [Exocentrus adspersus]|uniref:Cytochrome P450 n=1 Tax=Exocentrus adspersus TaxID=1586481 RepID=A0AAV8VH98_9CUCU|nr:hypothetical protein NQ315_017065 [Exocentrus adspersus]